MAKSSKKSGSVLPLIILFIVLCVAGAVGYVIYSIAQSVSDTTKKKMEKKNITMHRTGMTVGVKEVTSESYAGKTQDVLVKMWGNSNFKGRFDGKGTPTGSAGTTPASTPGVNTEKRKPFSRSASGQANVNP